MEKEWYLIAGLGNPGRQYNGSRHNVGFEVVDELIDTYGIDGPVRLGKSLMGKGKIAGKDVVVIKPMTYMNLSGEAVREAVDYFKIDFTTHLIVIVDDINLGPGHLRIRGKGSAGGHNGLKNIIQHLDSEDFIRVRVGVGAKPDPRYRLDVYVMGKPTGEDKEKIDETKKHAVKAVEDILLEGVQMAMSHYNR